MLFWPRLWFPLLDPTEGFYFLGVPPAHPRRLTDPSGVGTGPEESTAGAWALSRCQNPSF